MKENSKAYKGNSTAMKAVNAGEVDAALIYHYYYYGDGYYADTAAKGEKQRSNGRTPKLAAAGRGSETERDEGLARRYNPDEDDV